MTANPCFSFSIITGQTVYRIIHEDLQGCVDVVREAYIEHSQGTTVNPPSFFLRFVDRPNARIIGLPAHITVPQKTSGIKWIASFPDNIQGGFPRASAVLILNDHDTGYPFVCMEASIISACRTAASAVLAAYHLNRKSLEVRRLGIIGTGLIARYIYSFLVGSGWQIRSVHLYDKVQEQADKFCAGVCRPEHHDQVVVSDSLASVLSVCDLVLFATVAPSPYVTDPSVLAHNPTILHISLRDLAPELLLNACNIVDDVEHVMNANTSPHLAQQVTGTRSFITATLAEVIADPQIVDYSRSRIFSPFGLGILDVALGRWVFQRAVNSGESVAIPNFFYDLDR
jgi:ornithine cyclodeaminase